MRKNHNPVQQDTGGRAKKNLIGEGLKREVRARGPKGVPVNIPSTNTGPLPTTTNKREYDGINDKFEAWWSRNAKAGKIWETRKGIGPHFSVDGIARGLKVPRFSKKEKTRNDTKNNK